MTTVPQTQLITLEIPNLPRPALDEMYHFVQYLQFKYNLDLEAVIESIEDEIDCFDADAVLQESVTVPLNALKEELGLQ